MLDEMVQKNASKFAILVRKHGFLFHATFFLPNQCPGRHTPGHSSGGKNKVARSEKQTKTI